MELLEVGDFLKGSGLLDLLDPAGFARGNEVGGFANPLRSFW
jgi:hypothetical protein